MVCRDLGAEPKGEALDLQSDLHSRPMAPVGRDWKNNIMATSGRKVFFFPPHGVWAFSLEISWEAQVTRESVGVEPQLFTHIDKSQTRWLRHLIRLPPGHLPGEVFQAHPKGMRPRWRLRTCGRDHLPADLWILLGSSANWTKWPTFPAKTDETQIRLAEDNRWLGNKC